MRELMEETKDFPANPPEKQGYRLEFYDEFNDTVLNTHKWLPSYLPQWSSRERSAPRYSLSGQSLRLHIEADQPAWCRDYDGEVRVSSLQTGCFSGPKGSKIGQHKFNPKLVVAEAQPTARLYTPKYGYFETRLKAVPIPGYMVALWMIGFEEQPEDSAVIDICEIFGQDITAESSQNGYGVKQFNDPSISDESYRDELAIDASKYHIYAAEWTPTYIDFYVDNVKTRRVEQSPNYLMQFMLGIYELPDRLEKNLSASAWPKTCEVDYFRGYQPVNDYR